MSKVEQKTDGESVELSTTVQLAPHSPTDKVNTVKRDDIKEKPEGEYISLDDLYEVTGQESLHVIGANCRELNERKRLHKSAMTVMSISGAEGFAPGYDRLNAIKGAEGFVDALKKGFINIVKAVKRFIMGVIDWIVIRLKALFGFSKTAKQLAVVADHSAKAKEQLAKVLGDLAANKNLELDTKELYAALPGDMDSKTAFRIIHAKNKTQLEQVQVLVKSIPEIKNTQKLLESATQVARTSKSRYSQAADKLRATYKTGEVSPADIVEFRNVIDKELIELLNVTPVRSAMLGLLDKLYGIDASGTGIDKSFQDNMRKYRDQLSELTPVRVTNDLYDEYRQLSEELPDVLATLSESNYDATTVQNLKDIIDVKDAELIDNITSAFPGTGVLTTSYAAYCSTVSEYISALEHLTNMLVSIRGNMADIVGWANGVDRLMVGYISQDLKRIMNAEASYLSDKAIDEMAIKDKSGNQVGSAVELDYDRLFISHIPGLLSDKLGAVGDVIQKRYGILKTINTHLKEMGITVRF